MSQSKRHTDADKRAHAEVKHGRLAIFSACAINDRRISPQQLTVYAALSTHSSRSGYVDVPQDAIALRLGVARQYVQRTLAYLESLGYLKSARRKRSSDGGEASKAYKLELDYTLPVEHWRYVPTDYGSEPDENELEALFSNRPPATIEVAPPATLLVAPPATIEVAPPATLLVAPSLSSSSSSNNNALPRAGNSQLQPQTEAEESPTPTPSPTPTNRAALERLRAAAHLSPTTNADALAAMVGRYLAQGMTQDDLTIAASACAEWYAANRKSAPLLSNLNDWLQREINQRAKLEREAARRRAQEEATDYATATANAANAATTANAGEPTGSRPPSAPKRARSHQPQARQRLHGSSGQQCTGDASEWRPGSRAYVYDESTDTWTIITETGEHIPWRADQEGREEEERRAAASEPTA